jgi:hypothetical protein
MARSWGPVEKPVEHNVKGIAADEEGAVTEIDHAGSKGGPDHPNASYDATDGRHNKADHGGWPSIDPKSGPTDTSDFGQGTGRFKDGPGKWRQT